MKIKQLLAIFVITLIASIPFSFAISINVTKSSGNGNVEGFFDGYSDQWNIEVKAELNGTKVMPEYITARLARTSLPFDSCTQVATLYYLCSLKFPKEPSSFPENNLVLPIILTDPVTQEQKETSAYIGIDANPPLVTINRISQKGYNVEIDFTVKDGGSKVCSIDRVEFFDGNLLVESISVNLTGCTAWSNVTEIPLSDVGTVFKTIRVVAYDKIGHAGDAVSDIFVLDHTPPSIDVNSFKFTALGQDEYISARSITTDIIINITEEQTTPGIVEPLLVTADFSQLGLSSAETASCNIVNADLGLYTCIWANKIITIPTSFSTTITAEDNGGIGSTRTISKGFLVDSTPPAVVYLGGNESMYITVGSNRNTLRATLRESQSGIRANDILLDLRGIGGSFIDKSADECIQEGDLWECYWYNITATRAGSITLLQVKDIANNYLIDFPSAQLNVDNEAPVIQSLQILSLGGIHTEPVQYYEEGSYLQITAVVNDTSGVKAVADFRYVTSAFGKVAADCQHRTGNEWVCTWSGIGPLISVSAKTTRNIEFEFSDAVGNKLPKRTEAIDILDIGVIEQNPDYWTNTVGTGASIDKRLITMIFPYTFIPVSLNPAVYASPRDKWPLYVSDVQCTSSYLLSPAEIFNYNPPLPSASSTFPYTFYIKLNLIQVAPDSDSITIPCTFKVFTYAYGRSLPNPEIENVVLTVNYYNNPLGEIGDEVQAEIDEIKRGWLVKAEWLDWAEDILKISEGVCKAAKIWNDINAVWTAGVDGINNCCLNPFSSAACCPAKRATGQATTASKEALDKLYKGAAGGKGGFDKFCKIINCQLYRTSKDGESARNRWNRWVDWATETSGSHEGYFGNIKPEDSIILSIVFLCIKGVIYNLQKARQIDCRYAYCLQQTSSGMPVSMCVQQRALSMCKFVFNQIFNLIPFASVISDISKEIGDALANPWVAAEIATKASCRYAICNVPGVAGCKACSIIEYSSWVLETLCDLGVGPNCEPFWDTVDPIPENYCKNIGVGD